MLLQLLATMTWISRTAHQCHGPVVGGSTVISKPGEETERVEILCGKLKHLCPVLFFISKKTKCIDLKDCNYNLF